MLDIISETPSVEDYDIDLNALANLLASMSEQELADLEDDLDFAHFTGITSPNVLGVAEKVGSLSELAVAA